MSVQTIECSGHASIEFRLSATELIIRHSGGDARSDRLRIFLAFRSQHGVGSCILPFQPGLHGSPIFLGFNADRLITAGGGDPATVLECKWENWKWNPAQVSSDVQISLAGQKLNVRIPRSYFDGNIIECAVYIKDLSQNEGWGNLIACSDPSVELGFGEKYIPHYLELNLAATDDNLAVSRSRLTSNEKIRIYQLFVRLFSNINPTRIKDGTLFENGIGKFDEINDRALTSLRAMGFTHLWLMGVLQQATATDYSEVGEPADDPDILKGLAGSPYAIKDYFDVCPDYARAPAERLVEFQELVNRIHRNGMKVIIDLIANHVARSYRSNIKPDQNFGACGNSGRGDDRSVFFSPHNNFFYLQPSADGPPLRLPTVSDGEVVSPTCRAIALLRQRMPSTATALAEVECDGLFDLEKDHGKVTGNNQPSWRPGPYDWYETAKLNYGFDFTVPDKSVREYPNALTPQKPIPDTWTKMDSIIAYWQGIGVDGFRCDMCHMVPPEFWCWAIARARSRQRDVVFIGEAYDTDPAKVGGLDPVIRQLNEGRPSVMYDLLNAGFNAVYDDPTYRAIKKIYDGPGWANDIDDAQSSPFIFDNSLRYGENHDEVRLAATAQWGGVGMKVGIPACAILYGLSRGPLMLYNGQEVGEPGAGVEGFGRDDARTSIFDYWSMPELVKWVMGHEYDGSGLSQDQKTLRSAYARLINAVAKPAFRDGTFIPLNRANRENPSYGRISGEQPSGHWLYGFLRYDPRANERVLALVNLHPIEVMHDLRITFPTEVVNTLGLGSHDSATQFILRDLLLETGSFSSDSSIAEAKAKGIRISNIPALTARYLAIEVLDHT